MLKEHPQKRPTIYEVLREVCSMQGKEVPIRDVSGLLYPQADSRISRLLHPRYMPIALSQNLVVIRNFHPPRWKHLKWGQCSLHLSRKHR